jgi:NAD-dependent SIR2 family protein deacetylase
MTEQIVRAVQESGRDEVGLLNYIYGQLLAHSTRRGESPFESIDIERLIAAVQLLDRRDSLEISPFVAAWDEALLANIPRRDYSHFYGKKIADQVLRGVPNKHGYTQNIDYKEIQRAVAEIYRLEVLRQNPEAFGDLHEVLMVSLRASLQYTNLDYLEPLLDLLQHQGDLTILTLNYDLTIENLSSKAGIDADTGFTSWAANRALNFEGPLRLLKLHGSIDWIGNNAPGASAGGDFPVATYETSAQPYGDHRIPLVVFGAGSKLRADGPFLELFMEAKAALSAADELIVVGYSFRDPHINQLIRDWLSTDIDRSLMIVDPGFVSWVDLPRGEREEPERFRMLLDLQVGLEKHNRITTIRSGAAAGLAELAAEWPPGA